MMPPAPAQPAAPANTLPAESGPRRPGDRLLDVEGLRKYFPVRGGLLGRTRQWVRAVEDVSFSIAAGRTLGLVGESGCGKTTVGRALLGLVRPSGGRVVFEGQSLLELRGKPLRQLRRRMQIIFQDPYGSLNPRMTVGATVGEGLTVHGLARGGALRARVGELLAQVGLDEQAIDRYPHEFSGGQRQRIGIARALALDPAFVVCDEPTSALDVSIRAQVLNLLRDLQRKLAISYLMISHDLAVVRHVSHEVAVMYLGRIVEQAPTERLFAAPRHPYTRVLLSAIPVPDPERPRPRIAALDDEVPSPIHVPGGCAFHPRCPLYALKGRPDACRRDVPALTPAADQPGHRVACHFADDAERLLDPAAPSASIPGGS